MACCYLKVDLINCKCILKILGQILKNALKKTSKADVLRKERKENHITCSIKTSKEGKMKLETMSRVTKRKEEYIQQKLIQLPNFSDCKTHQTIRHIKVLEEENREF